MVILCDWTGTECSVRGSSLTWENTNPVFAFKAGLLFVPGCDCTFMFSLFKPSIASKAQLEKEDVQIWATRMLLLSGTLQVTVTEIAVPHTSVKFM